MPVKKYVTSTIKGEEVKLYFIASLAEALGRTTQTVRKWEISGMIPPCFKDSNGRRLYTEEQINLIVQIAEETKLGQGKSTSAFSNKVHKALKELNKKYV